MNKSVLNKNYVLLAVSGFVMILMITLSILKVKNLNETIELIKIESQAINTKQEHLLGLQALDRIRGKIEYAYHELKDKIPQKPSEHTLVEEIHKTALDNGFDLIQLKFEERVEAQNLIEMPFTFSIAGKYSSLVDLLDDLSSGNRLIRINEIQIIKDETVLDTIRADITAVAFSNNNAK